MENERPADGAADRHFNSGDDLLDLRAERRLHDLVRPGGRPEIRWIDYYENSGFGLEHYVQELKKRREQHGPTASATITSDRRNNGEISHARTGSTLW